MCESQLELELDNDSYQLLPHLSTPQIGLEWQQRSLLLFVPFMVTLADDARYSLLKRQLTHFSFMHRFDCQVLLIGEQRQPCGDFCGHSMRARHLDSAREGSVSERHIGIERLTYPTGRDNFVCIRTFCFRDRP